MVRTQVYLDDELHARLKAIAREKGRTVSALVRETLHRVFGPAQDERARTLEAIVGLWRDRKDIGSADAYIRRLRRGTRRRRILGY